MQLLSSRPITQNVSVIYKTCLRTISV